MNAAICSHSLINTRIICESLIITRPAILSSQRILGTYKTECGTMDDFLVGFVIGAIGGFFGHMKFAKTSATPQSDQTPK